MRITAKSPRSQNVRTFFVYLDSMVSRTIRHILK